MNVLLTTGRAIFLYEDSGLVEIQSSRQHYYGLTWDKYGPITGHEPTPETDIKWPFKCRGYITYYMGSGSAEAMIGLLGAHQIEADPHTGYVAIADTGRNRIVLSREWWKSGKTWDLRPSDRLWDFDKNGLAVGDHLNSVHFVDQILHVIAHENDRPSRWLAWDIQSKKLLHNLPLEVRWGHNLAFLPEGIIVCNSKDGSIRNLTTEISPYRDKLNTNRMTRGLAVTRDHYVVGWSEKVPRKDRLTCQGGLYLIPRPNTGGREVQKVDLGPIGAVREVRVIGEPDYAHNGVEFKSEWLDWMRR